MPSEPASSRYTSPREIVNVSSSVELAGPPVIPNFIDLQFSFRTINPDSNDCKKLERWFAQPYLIKTWEQNWDEERWRMDASYRLAGNYSRPLFLTFGNEEIAYVELYRVARDEVSTLYPVLPHDIGFHLATLKPELIGKGFISQWMGTLATEIFRADPFCCRVTADPAASNVPIRRALIRQGWNDLGEFDIRPDRQIALHILGRTPDAIPTPHLTRPATDNLSSSEANRRAQHPIR